MKLHVCLAVDFSVGLHFNDGSMINMLQQQYEYIESQVWAEVHIMKNFVTVSEKR